MDKAKVFFLLAFILAGCITRRDEVPTVLPSAQASQTASAEHADNCIVRTGIIGGTVNLRECKGAACGEVVDILQEGETVTIITAGEYYNVTTDSGAAGWLNSKYISCSGE